MPDTATGGPGSDGGSTLALFALGLLMLVSGGGYMTARHFKLLPTQRLD